MFWLRDKKNIFNYAILSGDLCFLVFWFNVVFIICFFICFVRLTMDQVPLISLLMEEIVVVLDIYRNLMTVAGIMWI